jgi:predicted dehydrogenase
MRQTVDQVRVGIIGAGRISDLHAIEYRNNPHAEIAAIADVNTDQAAERARAWGFPNARIFRDYRALLDDPRVNAVEILLPHNLHCEAAIAALDAGKHVSLQKPMTRNLAEADRVVARAQAAPKQAFKVFENFIFYPPVMKAKALVDQGAIGDPITIRVKSNPGVSRTGWKVPAAAWAWRMNKSVNGGGPVAFDDGHHKFALGWHFMGQPEQVHAWIGATTDVGGSVIDAPGMISWKFKGQRYGVLEIAYSRELEIATEQYAQDDRVEITGSRGVIFINRGHGRIMDGPAMILCADGKTESFNFSDTDLGWPASFVHSVRHFITALRSGGSPSLTGEQGREVLRFTLAGQLSAELGRAVRLDEVGAGDHKAHAAGSQAQT